MSPIFIVPTYYTIYAITSSSSIQCVCRYIVAFPRVGTYETDTRPVTKMGGIKKRPEKSPPTKPNTVSTPRSTPLRLPFVTA